jgi:hypothetical protein
MRKPETLCFKAYRCTSSRSPCPDFTVFFAWARRSAASARPKFTSFLKWSLSSRRTYRLSPLCGSINSRFDAIMVCSSYLAALSSEFVERAPVDQRREVG